MWRYKTGIGSFTTITILALITVAPSIFSLRIYAQEATSAATSSELLLKWKHTQRITLDMEKALPAALFQEIQRQSGVKIEDGTQNDPPATLKLKDATIWEALAETSAACKTGLELGDNAGLDRGSRSVCFHGTAWFPPESRPRVFDRYQVLGPFLIGMCWSNDLLRGNGNKQPGLLLRVLHFPTEAYHGEIHDLALRDDKGKRWPLQPAKAPDGVRYLDRSFFAIPAGLDRQKVDLCGSFEAGVYLNPKDYVIPITRPLVKKFDDDFGGLSIRVVKTPRKKSPDFECKLDWNLNLNDADTKIYKKFLEADRNDSLTPEDAAKADKWMKSKRDEIRLLRIKHFLARDKDGNVAHQIYSGNDGDRLELQFPKGLQPAELLLRVAELKQVSAVFELKNVFSK